MTRRLVYLGSVAIVLWGMAAVPFPYVVSSPGEAVQLNTAIDLDGAGDPITGQLSLLTVRVKEAGVLDIVRSWIDDDRELDNRDQLIAPGTDTDDHFTRSRARFRSQVEISATVALRALGHDVGISTTVGTVVDGLPADGVLQSGDVLLIVDGVPAADLDDVLDAIRRHEPGTAIDVEFERDGERRTATLALERLPGSDTVGLGIQLLRTVDDLPVDVHLEPRLDNIGGPSAGLALALAILDLLSPDDLVAGRRVAVTGTLDADGNVGNVGGIRQKVIAAEDAGLTLMLVPAAQVAEARARAETVQVVGVRTFDQALDVLRRE